MAQNQRSIRSKGIVHWVSWICERTPREHSGGRQTGRKTSKPTIGANWHEKPLRSLCRRASHWDRKLENLKFRLQARIIHVPSSHLGSVVGQEIRETKTRYKVDPAHRSPPGQMLIAVFRLAQARQNLISRPPFRLIPGQGGLCVRVAQLPLLTMSFCKSAAGLIYYSCHTK